eukprot:jgi/Bigna1/71466/fgenesh1_pg.15_\
MQSHPRTIRLRSCLLFVLLATQITVSLSLISNGPLTSVEKVHCAQVKWLFRGVGSNQNSRQKVKNLFQVRDFPTLLQLWHMKSNDTHGQVLFIEPGTFKHDASIVPQPDLFFGIDTRKGAQITRKEVMAALDAQRTVIIHNLEIYWGPVARFSLQLAGLFHMYAQANLYWSPGGLKSSISPHQDAQSVFIVQLSGYKTWKLFRSKEKVKEVPNGELALKRTHQGKGEDILKESDIGGNSGVILEARLSPGDVLFIPRAMFHSTTTAGEKEDSLHITIGIETETDGLVWGDILTKTLSNVATEAPIWSQNLRESIPIRGLRSPQDKTFLKETAVERLKILIKNLETIPESTWEKALGDTLSQTSYFLESKWAQQRRFLENFESRTKTSTRTSQSVRKEEL